MVSTQVTTYKNYIGGQWVESQSGRTYPITNPAHRSTVLGEFQMSTPEDALRAVDAQGLLGRWPLALSLAE